MSSNNNNVALAFTADQRARVEAKRAELQAARAADGLTPQLICEEVSAWIAGTFGYPKVPGAYGGVPHNYNVARLDGASYVVDASADQFTKAGRPLPGLVVRPVTAGIGYTWFDSDRRREAEDRTGGPVRPDPVFDEHGLFRPLEEHPACSAHDDDAGARSGFVVTLTDDDQDPQVTATFVRLWHVDRPEPLQTRTLIDECGGGAAKALIEAYVPRRLRATTLVVDMPAWVRGTGRIAWVLRARRRHAQIARMGQEAYDEMVEAVGRAEADHDRLMELDALRAETHRS